MLQGWIDADGLRVRFGVHQTRMPIAGGAADAKAFLLVFLIEPNSQRHMKRLMAELGQVIMQLLDSRLVADGRMWIRRAGIGGGWTVAPVSAHLLEGLGLGAIRLPGGIGNRPRVGS